MNISPINASNVNAKSAQTAPPPQRQPQSLTEDQKTTINEILSDFGSAMSVEEAKETSNDSFMKPTKETADVNSMAQSVMEELKSAHQIEVPPSLERLIQELRSNGEPMSGNLVSVVG